MLEKIERYGNAMDSLLHGTPFAIRNFRRQHPHEPVRLFATTKGRRMDNEMPLLWFSRHWAFARYGTLILTDQRLKCGNWSIWLNKLKFAELAVRHQSVWHRGMILHLADYTGDYYQFGMAYLPEWLTQNIVKLKVVDHTHSKRSG